MIKKISKWVLLLFSSAISINTLAQAPIIKYNSPQSYAVNNPIAPLIPTNTGGVIPPNAFGVVSTYAGNGISGSANGDISTATFAIVANMAYDAEGNMIIADRGNNQIRKITPSGIVSVVAGTGASGTQDGPGNTAIFATPFGVAVDNAGNIFVSDANYGYIRKIDAVTGIVSTLAGKGTSGFTDGKGTDASFFYVAGSVFDANGNLFIADANNGAIRKMLPDGTVTTFAGNGTNSNVDGQGTAASFRAPYDIKLDGAGNFIVADAIGNRIRKITPGGLVSTYAGNGSYSSIDGPVATATFNTPVGLAIDKAGNIYVAEGGGNKIRKISPTGNVTTIAGTGATGFNNGKGNIATFDGLRGLLLNDKGMLYVADENNHVIRQIALSGYTINKVLPAGLEFDATTGTISGTPTASSPATDYTITGQNEFGYSSTTLNIKVTSTLLPSVITFPELNYGSTWDNNFNIPLNITSTNTETPIIITTSDPAIATVNPDGSLHILGIGTVTITATQAGNTRYEPASTVAKSLTLSKDNQILTFPAITSKTICDPDFSTLVTSTNTTIPIVYSSSNPAVATISSNGNVHIVGTGTTTITATQDAATLYNAAIPASKELTVTPTAALLATITPDYNATCEGMPVVFTAVVSNALSLVNYQWQVNDVNTGANSNTFSTTSLIKTDVVKCLVSTTDACPSSGISNSLSIFVLQYTMPEITIAPITAMPVCTGTPLTFKATATNGGTNPIYQWQVNGISAGTNADTFTSSTLADGDVITCNLTNQGGACLTTLFAASNPIFAEVTSPAILPSVSISPSANSVYAGTSITFTASLLNTGTQVGYQWYKNGVNVGTNSNTYTSDKFLNNDVVNCTITTNINCTAPVISNNVTVIILPPPAIRVANTFTPNGDGVNDTWAIPDLSFYPNCVLKIFNRYGNEIVESRGYTKPWDGNMFGTPVPTGTYYYVIDTKDGQPKLTGSLTILR
jgi:gliding motility-associated-like protein